MTRARKKQKPEQRQAEQNQPSTSEVTSNHYAVAVAEYPTSTLWEKDLPEGLLHKVFETLCQEGHEGLQCVRHSATVCKAWNQVAFDVLLGDTAASRPARPLPMSRVVAPEPTSNAAPTYAAVVSTKSLSTGFEACSRPVPAAVLEQPASSGAWGAVAARHGVGRQPGSASAQAARQNSSLQGNAGHSEDAAIIPAQPGALEPHNTGDDDAVTISEHAASVQAQGHIAGASDGGPSLGMHKWRSAHARDIQEMSADSQQAMAPRSCSSDSDSEDDGGVEQVHPQFSRHHTHHTASGGVQQQQRQNGNAHEAPVGDAGQGEDGQDVGQHDEQPGLSWSSQILSFASGVLRGRQTS